jgi:Na+-translocating ferredoxin:NAD+ oxidoreductase RnfG subunit
MFLHKASAAAGLIFLLTANCAWAHVTPPVVLVPERDALAAQLGEAKKLSLREVSLTADERKAVQSAYGWRASDEPHAFYMGRDDAGKLLGAAVFMTQATMHGIIRVAVALTPDGRVKSAEVAEVAEEIYPHLKPLIDRGFTRRYAGLGIGSSFESPAAAGGGDAMAQHYDAMVSRLVQRAVILYDVCVTRRGVT